jgi:hypothetical protein
MKNMLNPEIENLLQLEIKNRKNKNMKNTDNGITLVVGTSGMDEKSIKYLAAKIFTDFQLFKEVTFDRTQDGIVVKNRSTYSEEEYPRICSILGYYGAVRDIRGD